MSSDATHTDRRVLLLAPTARDGEATRGLLASAGIECRVCANLVGLCDAISEGVSTIIVPEEVVLSDASDMLAERLRQQPVWSDVPVLVLSRAGAESPAVEKALATLGNVSLIERPMRVSTLLSVVRAAIRARERQYQVRDHLEERRRISEERVQLLEAERTARAEAERNGRMKDEFLATLSHELRTPLNAILGWSQILAGGSRDAEDLSEGLSTIERNARAQTQIIEDLLDMSRIISGKVSLSVRRVDLLSIVQGAVKTAEPAAQTKGVRLSFSSRPINWFVIGDPNRLQQVMWNLLTNAIKFTPAGGDVRVSMRRADTNMEVSVSDTGEGIPAAFQPHVFDRFRQADASTTRRHGGLGLGLAIVKQLVELHGGTIRVKSDGDGRGSTFTVALPLVHAEVAPEPATRSPATKPIAGGMPDDVDLSGVRVLVVDDEPDARGLVRRLLEDCGAAVTLAASAAEALALLKADRPDVVVSDIGMPNEDGYAFIQRVRSLSPTLGGDVPAVALTAYARREDRARSSMAGFQTHLAKPIAPAELITTVASLAGRSNGA